MEPTRAWARNRTPPTRSRRRAPINASHSSYRLRPMVKLARFMARILLVDDDQGVRESTARMLRSAGYTVQVASTGEEAYEAAKAGGFDVVLSDMRMPGLSGIDVLRKLREGGVDASFI